MNISFSRMTRLFVFLSFDSVIRCRWCIPILLKSCDFLILTICESSVLKTRASHFIVKCTHQSNFFKHGRHECILPTIMPDILTD